MLKIDEESIKKLLDVNTSLNQLEVKGASNVQHMYNSMILLGQVIQKIQELNKVDNKIIIDNTKGG
jgi:hypothetical protein